VGAALLDLPGAPGQHGHDGQDGDEQEFSEVCRHGDESGCRAGRMKRWAKGRARAGCDRNFGRRCHPRDPIHHCPAMSEPSASSSVPSPFYAHLSRLRFIKRWGLMRNAVAEDVAQPSWEASVLAHALAVISREVLGQDVDPNAVATPPLFRDAPEAITGE